jgi:hypothetical protein
MMWPLLQVGQRGTQRSRLSDDGVMVGRSKQQVKKAHGEKSNHITNYNANPEGEVMNHLSLNPFSLSMRVARSLN